METVCTCVKSRANGSQFSLFFSGGWKNGNLLTVSDKHTSQGHMRLREEATQNILLDFLQSVFSQAPTLHLKHSRKPRLIYPTSMALQPLKPGTLPTGSFPDRLTAAGHGDLYHWNPLLPVSTVLVRHPAVPPVLPPLQTCALLASSMLWIHTWLSTPWSQMSRLCGWPSKTLSKLRLHNPALFTPCVPWTNDCPLAPPPLFLVPSLLLLEVNDFGDCLWYLTLWRSCPWESQPLRCELGLVIYFEQLEHGDLWLLRGGFFKGYIILCLFLLFSEMKSPVVQAGLELARQQSVTLNSWSFSLCLLIVWIKARHHYVQCGTLW